MEFTDKDGNVITDSNKRDMKFIEDMNAANIEWRTYSGRAMYGRVCPGVTTSDDVSEEDIIRATTVKGLKRDNMGRRVIVYTGY